MARKIIQVSSCGVERTQYTQCRIVTTALCDDGTVWICDNEHDGWCQLSKVPQGNVEEKILHPTTHALQNAKDKDTFPTIDLALRNA